MNSPELAPHPTARLPRHAVTPTAATALPRTRVTTVPNDEPANTDLEQGQNPLWVMAIALGVFCAVAALVMVL